MAPAFDTGLAILVFGVAAWTIAARGAFAAVAGFVAYGLLLALVWVRLAAPDVALTEAALGSGLTGGLLVAASTRLRLHSHSAPADEEAGATLRWAAGGLCVLVSAGLAAIVLLFPEPAPSLAAPAAANLPATGLGNPVTAVLMAYRAIDTLLEVVVLLLALIGIWSIVPEGLWGSFPGRLHSADRNSILAFVAQLVAPIGILIGIHIFWVGSVAPGGEFQGATILAATGVLAMMAGMVEMPAIGSQWLRLSLVAGPAVFLTVGLAGFAIAGAFLGYPPEYAKLLIVAIEIPLTLSIAAMLVLLVTGATERSLQR